MRKLLKRGKRDMEGIEGASVSDLCILACSQLLFHVVSASRPVESLRGQQIRIHFPGTAALPASDNKLSFPAKP